MTVLIAIGVAALVTLLFLGLCWRFGTQADKRDIQVELPEGADPNFAKTIQECFRTGKPVRGYYDKDGNYKTEVIE